MPIIGEIGRRSPSVRMLIWSIYIVLFLGSVTMVYPFLLMMAGSTKSGADRRELRVLPSFLTDRTALYQKHVEGLFNESIEMCRVVYETDASAFELLSPPTKPNARFVAEWQQFLKETQPPVNTYGIGYIAAPVSRGTMPHALRAMRRSVAEEFNYDLEAANHEMGTYFHAWSSFFVQVDDFSLRRNASAGDGVTPRLAAFKATRPVGERYYFSLEGTYKIRYLQSQYTRDIKAYNSAHGTAYASYAQVHLDQRLPTDSGHTPKEREDWQVFVRTILHLAWIRADEGATPLYRQFLQAKHVRIETLNRNYGTAYASFDEVPLLDELPEGGMAFSDWEAFVQGWSDPDTKRMHRLPAEMISLRGVEFDFRDWLAKRHGSVAAANQALGTRFHDWADASPPQRDAHWLAFTERTGDLRWEFATRNYIAVADFMLVHGRGILNTAIYCLLAVLSALIVNPLAAYALSRYRPPSSYKVLLVLLLPMAFPPMVTQIPVFLMLRDFSLLNTFWALVLPVMANGYAIFLLKGFFDSLPRELYESAELDGAGEFTIFWQITMSLSKPILAVIALEAFKIAYSNFMFALLICQDEKMWTLMVWLYQLQSRSSVGVVFASLIIAALPTFMVFAFAQNVIMRGIVVPVEK